jgi:hypothetical protein
MYAAVQGNSLAALLGSLRPKLYESGENYSQRRTRQGIHPMLTFVHSAKHAEVRPLRTPPSFRLMAQCASVQSNCLWDHG